MSEDDYSFSNIIVGNNPYSVVHSNDVIIRIDIPSLTVYDLPIGTAQKFRSEIETVGEPYWSIGGPPNYQLGTVYSTSILATDYLRHRTTIKCSVQKAVLKSNYGLSSLGMALLLSPSDYSDKLANAGEPFLSPNDAEIKFDVAYSGRRIIFSGLIGIKSVIDTTQGNFAFETIDFWAKSMRDKSIK